MDPVTAGVLITGIVGAYKAYAEYKAATAKVPPDQKPAAAKGDEAAKGEQAAKAVQEIVTRHGTVDEQADHANFERNPQRYHDTLVAVIKDIAARTPAVAAQLDQLGQQMGLMSASGSGSVNLSGQSKIYGPVAGTNTGEMSGSYTFGGDDEEKP